MAFYFHKSVFVGMAAFLILNAQAETERLFPQVPAASTLAIDHREEMNAYFEKYGVFERLRSDLRRAVKERATGLIGEVCKMESGALAGFFRELISSQKFDQQIDGEISKTNAMERALGIAHMMVGPEFSGGNFLKTKIDLDQIPSNRISQEMFYKWIGLGRPLGGFVMDGYVLQFDELAKRFLRASCI